MSLDLGGLLNMSNDLRMLRNLSHMKREMKKKQESRVTSRLGF